MNGFIATFLPSELDHLPGWCRISQLDNPVMLAHATVDLTRCELEVPRDSAAATIALEILQVLIPAHVRMRGILARRADPGSA